MQIELALPAGNWKTKSKSLTHSFLFLLFIFTHHHRQKCQKCVAAEIWVKEIVWKMPKMNYYFCPFVQYTLTSHSLFLLRTYSKNQTRTITTKRHECHKTVLYFVGEGDWYENLRTFGMTNRFDFSPKTHAAVQKDEARKKRRCEKYVFDL